MNRLHAPFRAADPEACGGIFGKTTGQRRRPAGVLRMIAR